MRFKKLTPLMTVEAIEPCLGFWEDRLGFARVAEVPEGDRLGFVILAKDGVELMYQSRASVEKDLGTHVSVGGVLYLEVEDLTPILAALAGAEVVVPERTTFYGARELFVREPGGHVVGFSQHGEPPADIDALAELRVWASIEIRMETGNLFVRGRVAGPAGRRVRCVLTQRDNVIHEERFSVEEFTEGVSFRDIPVRVWWPHPEGDQALYKLTVDLLDEGEHVLASAERRVGFKHVAWPEGDAAPRPEDVNGKPLALKSAVWTPLGPQAAEPAYREKLQALRAQGINLLRLEGEGCLEQDLFYDVCDELGLLVSQAFPPGTADEAAIVTRLQAHASLLMWSGCTDRQAALVDSLDPTRRCVPS